MDRARLAEAHYDPMSQPATVRSMLSQREAAATLGVSTATMMRLRLGGKGPPWMRVSDGPRSPVRYPLDALRQWARDRLRT